MSASDTDIQEVKTIVGNSPGYQRGINLDSTITYSKRESKHIKIDINSKPDFSHEDVLKKQTIRPWVTGKTVEEECPRKKVKNEEIYPITKSPILEVDKVYYEDASILLEVFFLSLPEEKFKLNSEIKWEDVFNSKYILDLRPRLLNGEWDSLNLLMNVKDILSFDSRRYTLDFYDKTSKKHNDFDYSTSLQIHDYSTLNRREYFDKHLIPPQEREGEKLFILIRTFHEHCYFPFVREEFPREILSEEQLVWVSHELGVKYEGLSRLELWKNTKNALANKCYNSDIFDTISMEVKILLMCTNRFEPHNENFGRNNLPLDILKIIIREGGRARERYLSEVREIERRVLDEEEKRYNNFRLLHGEVAKVLFEE